MTTRERKFYRQGYNAAMKARYAPLTRSNVGRPHNPRKRLLAKKFRLSANQLRKVTQPFLDQLDRCKDDDARRVLLGAVCGRRK